MTKPDKPAGDARRVTTGLDTDGRSTILTDADSPASVHRPGGATVTEIWRVDSLPADPADQRPLLADSVVGPPHHGLAVRKCTFPPDRDVDPQAYESYNAAVEKSYAGGGSRRPSETPGMHRTDTVDVLTVITGELTLVTETAETVLRPGDSVVQRGTVHAWSNRTSQTVVAVAIMMGAQSGGSES